MSHSYWQRGSDQERSRAKSELEAFERRILAKFGRQQPSKGPDRNATRRLVDEGRDLFALCWDALEVQPSDSIKSTLRAKGVEERELQLWAVRLALPVLSKPEILALQDQAQQAATWSQRPRGARSGQPTPQRCALWTIIHRLQIEPKTLVGKLSSGYAQYFDSTTNPIDQFLETR